MAQIGLDVGAFEAVPDWVGRRLRQHVDRAADGLLAELRRGDPQIGEEEAGRTRAGIAAGMRHFCDLVEDPGAGWERVAAFYLRVGRHLARDGRDPVETHQALRRSALVAWRTLGAVPGGLDLDRAALSLVVDAQFCYMDAVAEVIAAGYSAEVAERRDRREEPGRRRHGARLLRLLLAEPPADPARIAALAADARWPLPATVAAAAARPRRPGPARAPLALPDGVLADLAAPEPCLIVPDPDGRGPGLLPEALLREWTVALGPAVPVERAAGSLRWARETLALATRGVIPDGGLIRSAEHVPVLVVSRAGELIDDAAAVRLAPLLAVPPPRRERLAETLLALLEHNFNAADASRRLRVHPQTVRHRLRALKDLFGDELRDPRRCLEMELILHARMVNGDLGPASAR
ncbi:PucR C-terminal helix-turn-helix domain-containing protein [Actinomadura glauciflava]|uniref:helix-turn-helix domain-containing protein n=1 Tax=Actinomadura luteofluorescens TaxID=46163 RepID=UPI0021649362|nr:helix-turn-helix domain-containing protein [Actinomadura glauciflava]MCR3742700.1 PucR C-terminal helix-turn-helix domain-containing protein [Actinomadura glauciflava]